MYVNISEAITNNPNLAMFPRFYNDTVISGGRHSMKVMTQGAVCLAAFRCVRCTSTFHRMHLGAHSSETNRQFVGVCILKIIFMESLTREALILYTTLCILGVYGILQVMDESP